MTIHRRNPRRDGNELEIIRALQKAGVLVWRVSGKGLPDLLTCFRGRWKPLEVKRKGGKLTEAQETTYAMAPFPIVDSIEGAFTALGVNGRAR